MALSSFNTTLKYGASSPDKTVRIKDFPSILGKRSSIEVTDLSDDAQRFIPGIRQQEESFDFTANYDPEVYEEINGLTAELNVLFDNTTGSGIDFLTYELAKEGLSIISNTYWICCYRARLHG